MHFAAGLPDNVKVASFAWERGAKLQFTAPTPRGADGSLHWNENLKQVLPAQAHTTPTNMHALPFEKLAAVGADAASYTHDLGSVHADD